MDFVVGFLIWLGFALLAAFVVRATYAAAGPRVFTFVFAILGAFIGGMLGVSPYVYHNPVPFRIGGLIGAAAGALFFAYLYHFMARKAV